MKSTITKFMRGFALAAVSLVAFGLAAQSSLPAPGAGGSFQPNVSAGGPPNGIGWNPGPFPPSNWGGGWNGWSNYPSVVVNPVYNDVNQGITRVIACGYDNQGVWRVLPLVVSYQYNGVQYDVNVINAWNPWTDMWDNGVDMPAYSTSYMLRGVEYDFYTPLSTGTYYFNL